MARLETMTQDGNTDTPSCPRTWSDRHQPAAHLMSGVVATAFTSVWTLAMGFVALLICSVDRPPASLALHNLAQFQLPFFYPAVLLWWVVASQFRQVWLRPAGLAEVRRTPDGWLAVIPSRTGLLLGIFAVQLILFLTALTPLVLLGKRNPLWVWYLAGPLAVLTGVAVYRRWHHNPTVRVDDLRRTLSLSRGRRKPPLVVPWEAVMAIEVEYLSSDGSCQYDCQVTVRVGDGTESVRYGRDYSYPEPAGRFAAWLREHVPVGEAPVGTTPAASSPAEGSRAGPTLGV